MSLLQKLTAPSPRNLILVRHGETAWSRLGQHTGLTDIPLTSKGIEEAANLKKLLNEIPYTAIYSSPLQRALETAKIAGFGPKLIIDPELVEWDYGAYEGLTSEQIQQFHPQWDLFTDGVPSGETIGQITGRADRVLHKIRDGNTLLFSSAHFLKILTLRWLHSPLTLGKSLSLNPASLSVLGVEKGVPSLSLWNLI